MEENKEESKAPEEVPSLPRQRVAVSRRPKKAFSPEEIETRYKVYLEKKRGGK